MAGEKAAMQIGWMFPAQIEESVPDLENIDWERERDTVLTCERSGFEGVYVPDHLQIGAALSYESFSVLAALAEATSTINLGCLVSCVSFRNPALVAKISATIDNISGGRFKLGLGAGWHELEFRSYGYEFEAANKRVDRLGEAAEMITRLWEEPEVTFEGRYYRVDDCVCDPKPVDPYLIVGGEGHRVEEIAKGYADEWNFPGSYWEMIERAPKVEGVSVSWFGGIVVSRSRSHIDRITSRGYVGRPERYVAGTPEEVLEKFKEMESYGVDNVVLRMMDYPDIETMGLLADEVVPEI